MQYTGLVEEELGKVDIGPCNCGVYGLGFAYLYSDHIRSVSRLHYIDSSLTA